MSMLLMVQAMKIKVGNANRKLVLLKLADNANDEGVCWPSYQHIADHAECDRRTVMRHVKKLQEDGLLWVEYRKGEKGNSSNKFHLTLNRETKGSDNMTPPSDTVSPPPSDRVSPRTSHSLEPVNEPFLVPSETKRSKFKFNDNDLKLAEWMFSRVLVINPSAKKPNPDNWANTVRLMREIDNRTHAEISGLFDWANKDSFWCSNILSPEKLRKQWDKLTVKRGSDEGHQTNSKLRQQATDGLSESQRAIAAARAKRDGNTEESRPPMGSNGSVVYEQVGQDEWSDSKQLVAKGNIEPF